MTALVPFSRTASLGAPAASLTLSTIPATATHLLVIVRVRSDNVTTPGQWVALRLNSDAGPDTYDGNTLQFTAASATGLSGDGIDLEQWPLGFVTPSDAPAGIWSTYFCVIPRYALAEAHMLLGLGFGRNDDPDTSDSNFGTFLAGAQHKPAVLAGVNALQLIPQSGNLAAGSSITAIGLLGAGDASTITRAAGTLALDFTGPEFLDVTVAPGANNFTATNPLLGRTISVRISGGDGTTTIGLPAGTEVLGNTYVAGQVAWLVIRCVNEVGPAFIAHLRDVV